MRKLFILALLLLGGGGTVSAQGVYYISSSTGSNSNPGTLASPWKSHPYMNHSSGCDGAVTPMYTHHAGDKFVFKGGDTWPTSCFQITLTVGGSASAQDYYGVCLSSDPDSPCYGGTSWPATGWTRPFWGGSNAYIASGDRFIYANGVHDNTAAGFGYITIDNFEIGNWNVSPGGIGSGNTDSGPAIAIGGAQNYLQMPGSIVENMYIHDWVADTAATTLGGGNGWAYGTVYGAAIMRNSVISDQLGYYNVNNGTNHLINYPFMGGCAGCGNVSGLVVKYAWMGCSSCYSVHDSDFSFIEEDPSGLTYPNPPTGIGIHSHIIYDDGGLQQTYYVYNNAIHDSPNAGLNVYVAYESYVFNNVAWNLGNNGAFVLDKCIALGNPCNDSSSQVGYFANNTTDESGTGGLGCYRWNPGSAAGLGTLNMYNNICIPNGSGTGSFSVATINGTATNYTMNPPENTTYGFVPANKYSPSSADPNTVAKGTNLGTSPTNFCSISGLSFLCSDTSGAPWFGGAYKTRPTGSTGWDLGAYQGQGGTTGPPAISISSPSPGTISGSVNLTASCTPQGAATVSSIQFTIDGFTFGAHGTSSPYTLSWNTATAANANHVVGATCTDSNAQVGTAATVAVAVNNSIPGCFISTDNDSGALSWTANQAFTPQSANFTSTVIIVPNTANQDTVFALSQAVMTAYGQGAVLLRFNASGQIDAWNNTVGNYTWVGAPSSPITYTAGTAYTFTMSPNFTGPNAGTYSINETSPVSVVIATNFAVRSTASFTSLGFINSIAGNTTPDTQKVCNFQVGGGTSLSFSPSSLNFGNVTVSSGTPTLTIGVTSAGGSTTFSSVGISGDASFTINSNGCTGSQTSCSTVIKFAPTTTGLKSATVTYTDSATGSPQTVNVSGTGIAAAASATPSPTSVNFGNVQLHTNSTSGPIIVTLMNGPVTFTSVTFNNPDFVVASNTCTGSVSLPTCQTTVTFTPSSLTNESAIMTYTDNAPTGGSTQTVALVGTGVNFPTPAPATQFVWNGTIPIQLSAKGKSVNMDYPITCNCTYANQAWGCACN